MDRLQRRIQRWNKIIKAQIDFRNETMRAANNFQSLALRTRIASKEIEAFTEAYKQLQFK